MKHLGIVCYVSALALAAPAAAQLSMHPIRVNVPFPFYVANREMPAGKYTIGRMSSSDLQGVVVRQAGVKTTWYDKDIAAAMSISSLVSRRASSPAVASLVFNRYGEDRYFLSQIWCTPERLGVELPKTQKERELITSKVVAQIRTEQVVIPAMPGE